MSPHSGAPSRVTGLMSGRPSFASATSEQMTWNSTTLAPPRMPNHSRKSATSYDRERTDIKKYTVLQSNLTRACELSNQQKIFQFLRMESFGWRCPTDMFIDMKASTPDSRNWNCGCVRAFLETEPPLLQEIGVHSSPQHFVWCMHLIGAPLQRPTTLRPTA